MFQTNLSSGVGSQLTPLFLEDAMQPDEKLRSPEEKVHLEISNQADVIDFLADFVAKGRTRIYGIRCTCHP